MRKAVLAVLICALASPCIAKYSGGSGEPNDPYQIDDVNDLMTLANDVNDYNKCFIMTADIDLDPCLPGNQVFTTAVIAPDTHDGGGFDGVPFKGVFDGNGHAISNLTIEPEVVWRYNIGLFGYVDSTSARITNLGLINPDVKLGYDAYFTSSIVGELMRGTVTNCYVQGGQVHGYETIGGLIGINIYGYIEDCYTDCNVYGVVRVGGLIGDNRNMVSGCHSHGSVSGTDNTGGLVGQVYKGTVINSYATGPVTSDDAILSRQTGGLIGSTSDGVVTDCYSSGTVKGVERVGGLIGHNYASPVTRCYATGNVNGTSYVTGGLAGINESSIISQCYATGDVNGNWYVGGLVGDNHGGLTNTFASGNVTGNENVGCLVGYQYSSDQGVFNSYSIGVVSGVSNVGGLIGYNEYGETVNSFWDVNTSGQTTSDGGMGKTTVEMQTKSTFTDAGWDFNDVWAICETTNYPKLIWQILTGDIVCPDGVDIFDLAELCEQWLFEEIPADLAPPPAGDGIVDFADFSIFANQWGISNGIDELLDFTGQWLKIGLLVCSADISPLPDGDGRVNAEDFAVMANDWLEGF